MLIAVTFSQITSIGGAVLVIGTAILFPWLRKKGVASALFGPRDTSLVVPGTREEWLQRSCEAMDAARRFSIVDVSERDFELKAKYRVPPVWADLTFSFLQEGRDSTRINTSISVLPNLFTLITRPERRVLARFTRALGPLDRSRQAA
jgi:hypothetical protein